MAKPDQPNANVMDVPGMPSVTHELSADVDEEDLASAEGEGKISSENASVRIL